MDHLLQLIYLLAEEEKKAPPPNAAPFGSFWIPMLIIGILWYLILLRPQMNQQKERKRLLEDLKKNDKVVTIGGILGTVTNISSDGNEVTLRIDDNAKIRMLRSSIQSIVTDENKDLQS